jgi:U3 small nucleolar RNA-associated protein 14
LQVLLKEKAINSFALVEEQLKLQCEHAQLQQQYSEASAAVADLQQQAQQALDQQAAAEAAQQEAEKHYNAVLKDKQRTERQLQAAQKKLSTAVKVGALLTQYACDPLCDVMKCFPKSKAT